MRELKNKNVVEYTFTVDCDGMINGMGYFLTYEYMKGGRP